MSTIGHTIHLLNSNEESQFLFYVISNDEILNHPIQPKCLHKLICFVDINIYTYYELTEIFELFRIV